jgi:hypothetical protein
LNIEVPPADGLIFYPATVALLLYKVSELGELFPAGLPSPNVFYYPKTLD